MKLTTNLRKVDGHIMLAIPPAVLDVLHLQVGSIVTLTVEGETLRIGAGPGQIRPKYTLTDLLHAADYEEALVPEDREWIDSPAAGSELM